MKMENIESTGKSSPQSPLSPPEPIFTSAHAALKFAFNFSHGTLKRGVLAQMLGGGGNGRGLAGLDGAAQAGMIQCELGALSEVRRSIVVAKFSPQHEPCSCRSSCCRGWVENRAFGDAIKFISEYILVEGLTGNISHYRLRRSIVLRYFGVRVSFVELATMCGVNRDTASDLNKRVMGHLDHEKGAAMNEVDDRLRAAGIVASS